MHACPDASALPANARPHHCLGSRVVHTRRSTDWPVALPDLLPSSTLCEHLLYGLMGPEIHSDVVWLTQHFSPLFSFVHGSTSV